MQIVNEYFKDSRRENTQKMTWRREHLVVGSVDNTYNLTFETSHGETWDQKTKKGKIAREQKNIS